MASIFGIHRVLLMTKAMALRMSLWYHTRHLVRRQRDQNDERRSDEIRSDVVQQHLKSYSSSRIRLAMIEWWNHQLMMLAFQNGQLWILTSSQTVGTHSFENAMSTTRLSRSYSRSHIAVLKGATPPLPSSHK
jgi:hypothetical protein